MKRTVSAVLAVIMVLSIFVCLCTTASAAETIDATKLFSVKNTGLSDGKITYIVSMKKGSTASNIKIGVKFDSTVLSVPVLGKETINTGKENQVVPIYDIDGVYEYDEDGNKEYKFPGMFYGCVTAENSSLINLTYAYTDSQGNGYQVKSDKEFAYFTFDVIKPGVDTTVKFTLVEYNSAVKEGNYTIASVSLCTLEAPVLKSVASAADGVTVKWGAVEGAAKYRVYRKGGDVTSFTKVADTTSTSYTDSTAVAGTTYYYTVKAYNAAGSTSTYDKTGLKITFKAPLTAPVLSSVANAASGVTVKWGKVSSADKYRVYRKGGGVTSYTKVADTTSASYTDKTAVSGTKYTYTVKAFRGSETSSYDKTGLSITYLAQPKLSSAANAAAGVTVKWGAVGGAEKYRVYRKTGTGSWTKLADTTALSYTDKTAASGKAYSYTVKVVNASGNSTYDKTGKTVTYMATPKVSKISATTSGISLTWSKSAGASKYYVYRKAGSATSWTKIATVTGTSYTDKNVKNNTKYVYTIKAVGSATSAYVTSGWTYIYYTAPTLTSVTSTSGGVNFKWGKATGAKGYYVYRKTGSGSWTKIATISNVATCSYLDKTAQKGTKYTYTVKAFNGSYVSGYRSGLSVTDKY